MPAVKPLLDKYDVRPRKSLGQNFLVHEGYLKAVARSASLLQDDVALEIGAGLGFLTRELAKTAGKVVALEFDRDMLKALRGEITDANIEIVEGDALKFDYRSVNPGGKIVVVGNLPYNIGAEILFRLLDARESVSRMILMTQLEVARRFTAKVGSKEYSVLAPIVGLWTKAKMEFIVPPAAFFPRPNVHSAVTRFDFLDKPAAEIGSFELYSKIVHAAFSQRRKMIGNSLQNPALGLEKNEIVEWLRNCGVDPKIRAQNLSAADFAGMERSFPKKNIIS